MALQPTLFVFDSMRDGKEPTLKMTAKRYTTGTSSQNSHGLTLILTHCIGSHKEQWEPAIERMFELQRSKPPHQRIREAWSFDWQNHGDAAVLNREALLKRPQGVSVCEWAAALAEFLRSPQMRGHRIVGMGHSAGAGAVMLAAKDFPPTKLPYAAIVLIEAAMVTRAVFNSQLEDRMEQMNFAVNATLARRDTWESREKAAAWFAKRYPWNEWDLRVVRLLALHGLQQTDSPLRVTLKCDRSQEAVSYPDKEGHFEATEVMARVCRSVPVHVVWGTKNDLIPEFIQESLADASEGRVVGSVSKVEDAGHMIVQEQPDALAAALCVILDSIPTPEPTRSRL